MSVVIETTLGDITVDLFISARPTACMNFLKLCKLKYYNFNLFHTISRGFIAQTGDPTGSRTGGESIFGVLNGSKRRYFQGENKPRIKHTKMGLISFVGNEDFMLGSQFFFSLGEDLTYLDEKHCVFGEVTEGFDVLEIINEVICDGDDRPYQDVRITHTVILDDPFPDPEGLIVPSRSPSPSSERLMGGRIAPDEEIDEMEGKNAAEVAELQADQEAKARATILEMVGDIPDAEMAPPENVLFVCKLNPVTTDDDLEIIFNRFGKIKSCEVIRDRKSGDSLQYAFIEFEEQKACEDAYFKMDNILIDDRRIHVDFSQSVSKIKWNGKGRGVTHYDEKGRKIENINEKEKDRTVNRDKEGKNKSKTKYPRNENKDYRSYKKDDYSSNNLKNKPESSKRESERNYRRSPIREINKYSDSQRGREYKNMYKSEERNNKEYLYIKKQDKNSKNYKKHYPKEQSRRRRRESSYDYNERAVGKSDIYKKSHRKKYSSQSSDDCENKLSKKINTKRKATEQDMSNKERYKSKDKHSKSSKIRNSTSSSDSSDNEHYKKKKKMYKHSRTTESSSDSSSYDDTKYKKKINKKQYSTESSSDSSENRQRKQKSRKENRNIKKRKSSDSESDINSKKKRR